MNDLMNGTGEYHWADGKIYKGEWCDNKMQGNGEYIWPDKKRFIGILDEILIDIQVSSIMIKEMDMGYFIGKIIEDTKDFGRTGNSMGKE